MQVNSSLYNCYFAARYTVLTLAHPPTLLTSFPDMLTARCALALRKPPTLWDPISIVVSR